MRLSRRQRVVGSRRVTWVLDAAVVVSLLAVVFTGLGGAVRVDLGLFQLSVTSREKPLRILLGALLIKVLLGLTDGLFAWAARRQIPVVGVALRGLHRGEVGLRRAYLAHRLGLAVSLVAFLATLGLVEAYLRVFTATLPHALGNYVAFPYDTRLSSIYRFDPESKMLMMRPHFERAMYFNGYRWHHRTDGMGFRNPSDRAEADVVLLGDSMIYGHGVEETSTVRHHLEQDLGRPVANLGLQGAGIHQEYQVLRRFGVPLRPRYVFLFFLVNDIYDLINALSDEEMERFLRLPIGDHSTPYFDTTAPPARRFRLVHLWQEAYVLRAFDFLMHQWRTRIPAPAAASDDAWEALPFFRDQPRYARAMRVHLRALLKVQDLAATHGFRFVNVVLWSRVWPEREAIYAHVLADFCRRHDIAFYSLREALGTLRVDRAAFYLPGDGHLSDQGARWIAALLAGYVETGRFDPARALERSTAPRRSG